MSKAEINRSTINLLTFTNLSEMMINSCENVVESLCGKELFIQRRAFTIINVPGKEHSKQWPHYELMSGISPFTYGLWAPLHDIEDDGGAYYFDQKASLKVMKKEQEAGLVNGPTVLNLMGKEEANPFKIWSSTCF